MLYHLLKHWSSLQSLIYVERIENRLHWVCDVLCQEDTGFRRGGNAPTIWVIIHCFMLTTVRRHDYRTIHQGQGVLSCSYFY